MRGWNVRPNTAARRTSARSSGASASMRAIVAASAESGRPSMPFDSMAARSRSRRNCGLPPERVATTSSTCIGSGCCSAARRAMRSASGAGEGAQLDARDGPGRRWREAGPGGPPRDADQPAARGGGAREEREQLGRRLVHVVRVLDLDQRMAGQHDLEIAVHRLVQLGPAVLLGEHLDFGRRGQVDVEGDREQRQPRHEVGHLRAHVGFDGLQHVGIARVPSDAHHFPQQLAPQDVRRGRGIGFAHGVQLAELRRVVAHGFEQTRLADAGLADDVEQSAVAGARPRRAPRGSRRARRRAR